MIQIGEFEISECVHGGLWISRISGDIEGEGMQVNGSALTELIVILELFFQNHI